MAQFPAPLLVGRPIKEAWEEIEAPDPYAINKGGSGSKRQKVPGPYR